MFTRLSIILIFSILTFSCIDNNVKTKNDKPQNETPQVLDDTKINYDISSVKNRYGNDIIEELFTEAINNDKDLEKITDKLDDINGIKNDSLKIYYKYIDNNLTYWENVDKHIYQLSDTTLKKEIESIFDRLKTKYNNRLKNHTESMEILNSKAIILNDQKILMKLIVTEPMMNNYQRNELPDIQTINSLINDYDTLISNTKPYTEFNK